MSDDSGRGGRRIRVEGAVANWAVEFDQAALEGVDAIGVAGDDFDGVEDHAADREPRRHALASEVAVRVDARQHALRLPYIHNAPLAREEVNPLAQDLRDIEGPRDRHKRNLSFNTPTMNSNARKVK